MDWDGLGIEREETSTGMSNVPPSRTAARTRCIDHANNYHKLHFALGYLSLSQFEEQHAPHIVKFVA